MSATLPEDATLADVLAILAKPENYVRRMLENMYNCKREHGNAESRLGITGSGIAPHYRIEFLIPEISFGTMVGIRGTYVFDGRSHKPIPWIEEIAQKKDEMPSKMSTGATGP
jgi:hypothetical protein